MSEHAAAFAHQFDDAEQQHDASTLGMWVFLVTEIMFFAGMFTAYVAYRSLYPEAWAKIAAVIVFLGFNLTFFPKFVLGYLGMPRRYHVYPAEFQVLNVMSTAGASILGIGYLLPLVYFIWSLRYGAVATANPWHATGLEWQTPSPPPTENFERTPIVTQDAYAYDTQEVQVV